MFSVRLVKRHGPSDEFQPIYAETISLLNVHREY